MTFASRQDAGQRLGIHLRDEAVPADVVAGLPRGGVVVAAEFAHVLQRPLEVFVVRKIGHPLQREFAVGAMAEDDVVLLDERSIGSNPIVRAQLRNVIHEEAARLREYEFKFHYHAKRDFTGKNVLLVDDGLATGATMEAAVLSARKRGAQKTLVAVPVTSTTALGRLKDVADEIFALIVDPGFDAVGRYYNFFSQTTDEEVLELLKAEHAH